MSQYRSRRVRLCHGVAEDDMEFWAGTETTAIRRSDALDAWLASPGRKVCNQWAYAFRT